MYASDINPRQAPMKQKLINELKTFLNAPVQNLINDRQTRDMTEHLRSRVRPSKLGPALVCIPETATVSEAFALLKQHNLLALPVYRLTKSGHKSFQTIISVIDLLHATLLGPAFDDLGLSQESSNTDLEKQLSTWMDEHVDMFKSTTVKDAMGRTPESKALITVQTTEPLSRLLDIMTSNVHRVLVYDKNHEGDENWYTIVSQTDLVWYLHVNRNKLPASIFEMKASDIMQSAAKPIPHPYLMYDLDTGASKACPISLLENTPTAMAVRLMALFNTSCVGIVDEQGKLAGNLSGADFRGFNEQAIRKILDPVLQYIHEIHNVDPAERSPTCEPENNLEECMQTVLSKGVHRLWVCPPDDKMPIGLITLSDMLVMFKNPAAVAVSVEE
ncbi:uncharacterized protein SPPG_00026 [Spizellomyces punctatus DAOM BR117]|uniref:CBS domain-containing protein n=1 Tax=Spizellomyces punctatus (strain DAOM BR117) TaxID=645134 RepID=A0A0L0HT67_SPIPD|nr:uncharacterized protein SPPG_00026 [Spizellomyces punctatus DAOM BR117]KND04292.1 hypothetical protein SPPG_00026 [Spizellomyces punctatus DAOM BR117]|eukprot:XP_016612331.1 hypothetical protein SPPG_00026 [Spizellomyces punctatus DAOM BR117]